MQPRCRALPYRAFALDLAPRCRDPQRRWASLLPRPLCPDLKPAAAYGDVDTDSASWSTFTPLHHAVRVVFVWGLAGQKPCLSSVGNECVSSQGPGSKFPCWRLEQRRGFSLRRIRCRCQLRGHVCTVVSSYRLVVMVSSRRRGMARASPFCTAMPLSSAGVCGRLCRIAIDPARPLRATSLLPESHCDSLSLLPSPPASSIPRDRRPARTLVPGHSLPQQQPTGAPCPDGNPVPFSLYELEGGTVSSAFSKTFPAAGTLRPAHLRLVTEQGRPGCARRPRSRYRCPSVSYSMDPQPAMKGSQLWGSS